ncbi:hypothetical protein [Erythrobacter sp. Alg231-14]|uniref:hypothetical protein n=1 Tax=Erythrobacter sp. Alg231-14 TaxID=1922225 RepID=UPI000D55AE7E
MGFISADENAPSVRNWTKTRDMLQGLPLDWKRSFPAATLLEAETEIALGNRAIARTMLMQLADDPRISDQVAEILQREPFDN